MAELAESVGSKIWKALPAQPPPGSAVWFSISTFLGYVRGRAAGVARGQVVVRLGSGEGRTNTRSLARLVAEDLGVELTTSVLTTIKGWASSRRFQAEARAAGTEDDLEGGEGAQPRTLDLFVSPKTLKSVLEATALEPGSLSIVGVLARQLPQAAAKVWSSERHRRRLIAQAVSSATVESEVGEERGWTRQLLHGTMHKSCQAFAQQELEELLKTLEDSTARAESEDEEDEEDDPILLTNRAAGGPPVASSASPVPAPSRTASVPQPSSSSGSAPPVTAPALSRPLDQDLLA